MDERILKFISSGWDLFECLGMAQAVCHFMQSKFFFRTSSFVIPCLYDIRLVQSTVQFFSVPAIISGTGKATDFKFGQYIQTVHLNKCPLKILEKRERGRIQGLPNFFGYPDFLRNG